MTTSSLFDQDNPGEATVKPIKLSPTSLNLFSECPKCFWLEKKMGFRRPPPFPYTLNSAVDTLVKNEFDDHREKGTVPPILTENDIPAKPFGDMNLLKAWRNNFQGVRYYDESLDATLFGAVDDVLEFEGGALAPLDAKATGGKSYAMHDRFRFQLSTYSYLMQQSGHPIAHKGFIAYYVAEKDGEFDNSLPFKTIVFETETDEAWVQRVFKDAVALLRQPTPPEPGGDCSFCKHVAVTKGYY